MNQMVAAIQRLAPEALEMIRVRYRILREIFYHQPVGRRLLAQNLGLSERVVRSEIEALKEMGLVRATAAGVVLGEYGLRLLEDMDLVIAELEGLSHLAQKVKEMFSLEQVLVVPGDSYLDHWTKKDLGRAAAFYIKNAIFPSSILAVTGGSTMAEVAQSMYCEEKWEDVLVLPARGGLGEEMDYQANSIAYRIAKAIGGQYRLLHVPDNLDEMTIATLSHNEQIKDFMEELKRCDILVYGIGAAKEMASRRGLSPEALGVLEERKAVGEAFRYYFDEQGNMVYSLPGIGMEFSDLSQVPHLVAVAGGSNKAKAIEAVLKNLKRGVLITDEGAARAILERRGGNG